ncbi:unnamed protein product [Sympodiomycopsis kandeliae]
MFSAFNVGKPPRHRHRRRQRKTAGALVLSVSTLAFALPVVSNMLNGHGGAVPRLTGLSLIGASGLVFNNLVNTANAMPVNEARGGQPNQWLGQNPSEIYTGYSPQPAASSAPQDQSKDARGDGRPKKKDFQEAFGGHNSNEIAKRVLKDDSLDMVNRSSSVSAAQRNVKETPRVPASRNVADITKTLSSATTYKAAETPKALSSPTNKKAAETPKALSSPTNKKAAETPRVPGGTAKRATSDSHDTAARQDQTPQIIRPNVQVGPSQRDVPLSERNSDLCPLKAPSVRPDGCARRRSEGKGIVANDHYSNDKTAPAHIKVKQQRRSADGQRGHHKTQGSHHEEDSRQGTPEGYTADDAFEHVHAPPIPQNKRRSPLIFLPGAQGQSQPQQQAAQQQAKQQQAEQQPQQQQQRRAPLFGAVPGQSYGPPTPGQEAGKSSQNAGQGAGQGAGESAGQKTTQGQSTRQQTPQIFGSQAQGTQTYGSPSQGTGQQTAQGYGSPSAGQHTPQQNNTQVSGPPQSHGTAIESGGKAEAAGQGAPQRRQQQSSQHVEETKQQGQQQQGGSPLNGLISALEIGRPSQKRRRSDGREAVKEAHADEAAEKKHANHQVAQEHLHEINEEKHADHEVDRLHDEKHAEQAHVAHEQEHVQDELDAARHYDTRSTDDTRSAGQDIECAQDEANDAENSAVPPSERYGSYYGTSTGEYSGQVAHCNSKAKAKARKHVQGARDGAAKGGQDDKKPKDYSSDSDKTDYTGGEAAGIGPGASKWGVGPPSDQNEKTKNYSGDKIDHDSGDSKWGASPPSDQTKSNTKSDQKAADDQKRPEDQYNSQNAFDEPLDRVAAKHAALHDAVKSA